MKNETRSTIAISVVKTISKSVSTFPLQKNAQEIFVCLSCCMQRELSGSLAPFSCLQHYQETRSQKRFKPTRHYSHVCPLSPFFILTLLMLRLYCLVIYSRSSFFFTSSTFSNHLMLSFEKNTLIRFT